MAESSSIHDSPIGFQIRFPSHSDFTPLYFTPFPNHQFPHTTLKWSHSYTRLRYLLPLQQTRSSCVDRPNDESWLVELAKTYASCMLQAVAISRWSSTQQSAASAHGSHPYDTLSFLCYSCASGLIFKHEMSLDLPLLPTLS